MSAPRYIEHLTITSGNSRRCWREEVAGGQLAQDALEHRTGRGGGE